MITRASAATVGLLVFVGMLLTGFLAGNPFDTIIRRALLGLGGGLMLGYVAARLGRVIVHEHFRQMVQADTDEAEAEAATAEEPNGQGSEDNTTKMNSENKEDRQDNREIGSPPADRSVSTRAAQQAIQEAE